MKKILVLIVSTFPILSSLAQDKQFFYFLKENGNEVQVKDSADFIRIISLPEKGEKLFSIQDFYIDGRKKLLGKAYLIEPYVAFEGLVLNYYPNGKTKSSLTYAKNVPIGNAYFFFENGKVRSQLEYADKEKTTNNSDNNLIKPEPKLIYQIDSLGEVSVKDGNGYLIEKTKVENDTLIEEGNYKNGYKDGEWKGKYVSGKSSYTETYADGKFISGVNTIGIDKINYAVLGKAPDFEGGVDKFYQHVISSLKYPKELLDLGLNGYVVLRFKIAKDGQVGEIEVLKSLIPSADEEALRVIRSASKWIPGYSRGVPVEVYYTIPIRFFVRE